MKLDRYEITFGRLCISVLLFFFLLGCLELISRKFMPARSKFEQRYPVQKWRNPRPYCMFSGKPGTPGLNSLGYVGDVPALPKPSGEYRVIFLGGSTTVEGSPPIAELVQGLFHKNGHSEVRVYNFGVVSSVSSMEMAKILFEIVDLQPDLIVMYNGGNDMLHPLRTDPRPGYPFNFLAYENNPLLDKDINDYPTITLLAYGSNLMRRFFPTYFVQRFGRLEELRKETKYLSPEWRNKVAEIYVANLIKSGKLSQAFGANFITFFQPLVYYKDRVTNEEKSLLNEQDREIMVNLRELIRKNVRMSGVKNFIDLSDIYRYEDRYLFKDAIHTSQEAKPVVAQAMYVHMSRLIFENRRPQSK